LSRVLGSSSQAATQTAKVRWRLRPLIILAFLLFQALCVQPTADVLYAVIPSWGDPDTEDGDSITPLSAADVDKARGHTILPSPSPRGGCGSSDIRCRDQNPTFLDVAARAPPIAYTSSLYIRSSCWSQFDLDLNDHASVRAPTAFTIVHAIDPRLELMSASSTALDLKSFERNFGVCGCAFELRTSEQKEEISLMFNRFVISTTILILLALSSLGCAGGNRTSRVSPLVDVTGTWEGTFYFAASSERSVRWVLQQNGAKVRGEVHGPSGTASIEGLVNGELLDWTLTGPFVKFASGTPLTNTYQGEATVNTDQLSGRASGMHCPCTVSLRRVNK